MKSLHKAVLVPLLAVLFVAVGGLGYFLHFYRYKAKLDGQQATSETAVDQFREWLESRPSTDEKLREIAATTLGFSSEVVDTRFRSGLSRLALTAGLIEGDTVITPRGAPTAVKNPTAESRAGSIAEFRDYLANESISAPDLYLMEATIKGSGSFDAVTRLLALAQTQPWIWSVKSFTLKPQDDEARMFEITATVTTALLPDLAPPAPESGDAPKPAIEAPEIKDPGADYILAVGSIVKRNVFAPPPPPPPEIQVTQASTDVIPSEGADPVTPPAPPPAYHEWRLTGLSGSPTQGRLAWMLNTRTGTARLLRPGEGVLDAVLVDAEAERAVFKIGDARYALALNETLADRHRVE
ncbi:MAG: hypothetical protein IT431_05595 [Phycisphaerales bacterium]|nr:hypothetical protein [Phycisphaerales bacterium]